MTKNYKTRPIGVRYKDKIDLTYKILKLYSVLIEPLTDRNITLLAICILEDMNSDEFKDIVIKSNIGINNEGHLRTELSRLKDKGLIVKETIANRKQLSDKLQKFAKLINDNNELALFITFDSF